MLIFFLINMAIIVFMIVTMWKIYTKAGKPGWAVLIPIYNIIVWLEIAQKPWWWIFLFMIPYVGLVWWIWSINMVVKKFGKDTGFTVGCVFLSFIFFPILAFDDSTYLTSPNSGQDSEILDADVI